MLAAPCFLARARARWSTAAERSIAKTRRAHVAASMVRWPSPQPRSATSSGGRRWPSARAQAAQLRPGTSWPASVPCAVEVLAALPQHLLQPRIVGPGGGGGAGLVELRLQVGPEARQAPVDGGGVEAVVGEAARGLLGDQARVLEQAEVARDAGLGEAEDGGELGDVEALAGQHPEEAEPDVFPEQAVERGGLIHIYKSI